MFILKNGVEDGCDSSLLNLINKKDMQQIYSPLQVPPF
jgi:hypothetical protein